MLPRREFGSRNIYDRNHAKAISSSDPMNGCSNADFRMKTLTRFRSNGRSPLGLPIWRPKRGLGLYGPSKSFKVEIFDRGRNSCKQPVVVKGRGNVDGKLYDWSQCAGMGT